MTLPEPVCRELTLEIPSDPAYLKVVRGVCLCLAEAAGFPEDKGRLVALGLEEACTNVMRHAYENRPDHPIRLQFRQDAGQFVIELTDWGRKARPEELKSRDLNEIRPGGLGLHFISEVFDRFEYDASDETCNRLRLVKARPGCDRSGTGSGPSRA
ncbi:ATP-binding protein [bacterium]|nr:ATP-binding protein [bacterium]